MSIVEEAQKIVIGKRQEDYGDMNESFTRIAGLWSSYLDYHVDRFDVAKMMMLLKISRTKYGNHRDSYVDIIGYVECVDQMLSQNPKHFTES